MIVSFQHKGLERFYREDSTRGIQAEHAKKLRRILTVLDDATTPADLAIPSFRTQPLKGELAGHYSLRVSGNWRVHLPLHRQPRRRAGRLPGLPLGAHPR